MAALINVMSRCAAGNSVDGVEESCLALTALLGGFPETQARWVINPQIGAASSHDERTFLPMLTSPRITRARILDSLLWEVNAGRRWQAVGLHFQPRMCL